MTNELDEVAAVLRPAVFRLARRLRRERAVAAMSDAQITLLGTLRLHGRLTISALAECERVTAPSMSATITVLAEQGFVVRIPDDEDRRRVYVEITPLGDEIMAETIRRRNDLLVEILGELHLEPDELDVLRRSAALLRKLAEA